MKWQFLQVAALRQMLADLELAAGRLQAYINQEKVTLAVTLLKLRASCAEGETNEVVETV